MLHIVGHNQLLVQFERIADGDTVLFLADSILSLHKQGLFADQLHACMQRFNCYLLQADMLARGLTEDELLIGLKMLDYSGFVDLTTDHEVIKTWN